NGKFTIASSAACEQKIRNVGTCDQQNQRNHSKHGCQRTAGIALRDQPSARASSQLNLLVEERLLFLVVPTGNGGQLLFEQRLIVGIQRGSQLFVGDARLAAREHLHPVIVPAFQCVVLLGHERDHGQRNKNVG